MPARLIDIAALGEGELTQWRELAAGALEPNPFLEPDFLLPAAAHIESGGVALLVSEGAGGWSGCLAVRPGRWRGVVRSVHSWHHVYCFLGTPLLDPADPPGALAELLGKAAAGRGGGHVVLEWVPTGGPVREALNEALSHTPLSESGSLTFERAALHRREDGDYLGLSSKRRHDFERQRRRLGELLEAEPETVDRAGDEAAVERFLALEAAGWKGTQGSALASRREHAAFFREVCARFAAAGRLDLLELSAGGRTIAMKCNLAAGDTNFAFKIAYDEELSRFSPGGQLELDNVERFHASGRAFMDSCAAPDNNFINRLYPDRRALSTVILARGTLRRRASKHGLRALQAWRGKGERRKTSAAT